jgi:hypothetical protein
MLSSHWSDVYEIKILLTFIHFTPASFTLFTRAKSNQINKMSNVFNTKLVKKMHDTFTIDNYFEQEFTSSKGKAKI